MTRVVTVPAFAKINLGLRVTGRRPDGFHELTTVFQTIRLADSLTFRLRKGPFRLSCTRDDVPSDNRNLVWRAAALLWTALGRTGPLEGVPVSIRKRIPPQTGLGGGSADAAATLRALAPLWRIKIQPALLEEVGARLGADVPFFLCGGTALGLGRGDRIYPLAEPSPLPLVVAYPPFGVSTADAFGWFDADAGAGQTPRSDTGAEGSAPIVWRLDPSSLVNDLELSVVRRHPAIGEMIARLRDAGATGAAMSGSGSAVFGFFPDSRAAARAAARLNGREWTALATRTIGRRESGAGLSGRHPVV